MSAAAEGEGEAVAVVVRECRALFRGGMVVVVWWWRCLNVLEDDVPAPSFFSRAPRITSNFYTHADQAKKALISTTTTAVMKWPR